MEKTTANREPRRRSTRSPGKTQPKKKDSVPKVSKTLEDKVARPRATRTIRQDGPTTKVASTAAVKKHLEKDVAEAKRHKRVEETTIFLTGTRNATQIVQEDLQNVMAVCQNTVFYMAATYPDLFLQQQSNTSVDNGLSPGDVAAYLISAVIAAYSEHGHLTTSVSEAKTAFPQDAPIPIPIAEYIRHSIQIVGAPNISRRLTYVTDLTLSNTTIRSGTGGSNEIAQNQNTAASGLNTMVCGMYTVQPNPTYSGTGLALGIQDDFTLESKTLDYNLFTVNASGGPSWTAARLDYVIRTLGGTVEKIGYVPFKDVPRCTDDCSRIATPNGPYTWTTAKFAVCPSPVFDVYMAMFLNPTSSGIKFPSTTFTQSMPTASFAVQGSAGNALSGQAVGSLQVPISMTNVAQAVGTLNTIMLQNKCLKPVLFGKRGYVFCGQTISGISRIINTPIDVAQVAYNLVRAFILSMQVANNDATLYIEPGFLNGVYACAESCVISKILRSGQLEKFVSCSPNTTTNNWLPQALFPTHQYLDNPMISAWACYLANIGPARSRNTLLVPTVNLLPIGQGWSTGSSAAKYNFWSKFKYNSPSPVSVGVYPPSMITYSGVTATTPNGYRYPYWWGAVDPSIGTSGYWDSPLNTTTSFCVTGARNQGFVGANASTGAPEQLVNYWQSNPKVGYNSTYQASYYALNNANSGLEGTLCYQGLGVATYMASILAAATEGSGMGNYKPLIIQAELPGTCSMFAQIFTRIPFGESFVSDDPLAVNIYQGSTSGAAAAVTYSALGSAVGLPVLNSLVFMSQSRVQLSLTFPLVFQYIVSNGTALSTNDDWSLGWVTTCNKIGLGRIWDLFALECAKPGSRFNNKLDKFGKREFKAREFEQIFTTKEPRESSNQADGIAAAIEYVQSTVVPESSGSMSLENAGKDFDRAAESGHTNQTTAVVFAVSNSVEDINTLDDWSVKEIAGKAFKGIKTVLPDVVKAGVALAPLLL